MDDHTRKKLSAVQELICEGLDESLAIERLVERIGKEHLHGLPPEFQGAVLADLLALWLAGHAPQLREMILDEHLAAVHALVPLNESILFGDKGHPSGRADNEH